MKDLKGYSRNGSGGWLRDLLALVFILGIPFLQFLGRLPLIDPDEGRYAEIPREMLERGDLITPTLNYVKYFEKPPLLYWINAASMKIFGLNEFAARLPSALCGLLTLLTTYLIARRLYDRRTALLSALILGTSAGFVLQSRIILTDMLLTLCLTAALGAFIVAAQRDEGRNNNPLPWYLFYLFCALAVLAKGLIGIVFPAGIILFFLVLGWRWRILTRMHCVVGLLLFLAVVIPWFVAVSHRNPEFLHFFFIREHFERFTSTVHGRYQPFWFFLPVLLGTMLPWSCFIPGALSTAWADRRRESGQAGMFLLIWIGVVFLFFSLSSSKLVPYILPIFPPLAILISHRLCRLPGGSDRGLRVASTGMGIILTTLGVAALSYARLPQTVSMLAELMPRLADPLNQFVKNIPHVSTGGCIVIGFLFLIQGVVALTTSGRRVGQLLITICICSFLIEILVPRLIMGSITQNESPRELALKARSVADRNTRIVTFGLKQGVSWYMGRRVLVTGTPDELEFGRKQEDQSAWFPDRTALLALWGSGNHTLVFLKKNEFADLLPGLHPAPRVLVESGRQLLISNR